MPKGPKGERRPADVIGNAVKVMRIATGEIEDDKLNQIRAKSGKRGGKKRAKTLTAQERSEVARLAASVRWKKS